MRKSPAQLQKQVDEWNAAHQVGTEVEFVGYQSADPIRRKTRTAAQILQGHTAVVWLEDYSGCVMIECCTPVKKAAPSQSLEDAIFQNMLKQVGQPLRDVNDRR